MSAASLKTAFKRAMNERNTASNRKRLLRSCFLLAGSFMLATAGYSAVSYMAAQPALSRDLEMTTPPPAVKGKSMMVAPPVSLSSAPTNALNEPENGVKLLLSIFSRLGSSGGLAFNGDDNKLLASNSFAGSKSPMASNMRFRDADQGSAEKIVSQSRAESQTQFGQSSQLNAADPALSIRPQLNKRTSADESTSNQIVALQGAAGGGGSAGANYNMPGSAASQAVQQYAASNAGVGSRVVSENPYIREFMPQTKSAEMDMRSNKARRQVNIMEEPLGRARADKERGLELNERKYDKNIDRLADRLQEKSGLIEHAKDAASGADTVTGIIRPSEQPGLFKYVREYLKEPAKNLPAPVSIATNGQAVPAAAPVAVPAQSQSEGYMVSVTAAGKAKEEADGEYKQQTRGLSQNTLAARLNNDKEGASRFKFEANLYKVKAKAAKKSDEFTRIAFLPPNAVHGINGLPLGATLSDTINFLKTRGKVSKASISGFQVLTLRNAQGITLLQAFVRDSHLDALRVFNPTFVPPQLDVNLGEELPSMKAKFGEPAFILEEPHGKTKTQGQVAKNYVYPISQVSFQLSRPNASSAPQVLSMFLFRFL